MRYLRDGMMTIKGCKGAIFDLDGVITETAKIHFLAWKSMFDEFLKEKGMDEFSEKDYIDYVDGKPRYDGVKSFLESRKIRIPYGKSYDSGDIKSVCGLGNKKNAEYQKIIKEKKPKVFKSGITLIKKLKKEGVKVGIASSSKNTRLILKLAEIEHLFDSVVDGIVSEEEGLNGKPEPDIFVESARRIGVRPQQSIVFEDAISGVKAGKNGCFGLVVGVKRGNNPLKPADIVVDSLSKLTLSKIREWFSSGIEKKGWYIDYYSYDPEGEPVREAMSTVGNGYMGTRGCHATAVDDLRTHYPGTYIAGLFNSLSTKVHGEDVWNNDLVNCPNWLLCEITIGRDRVNPFDCEIIDYHQRIDMRHGKLIQEMVFKDEKERVMRLKTTRFVSMHDKHKSFIRYSLTPINFESKVTITSYIDGGVINNNVERYRQLNSKHLENLRKGRKAERIYVAATTKNSRHDIVVSAHHRLKANGRRKQSSNSTKKEKESTGEKIVFDAKKNKRYDVEKYVSIFTSIDSDDPIRDSLNLSFGSFESESRKHVDSWARLWDKADMKIEGDIWAQKISRLYAYHLLSTASPHNHDIDAGMPARGLHGEGYRGHIFWDELYILPFYNLRFPDIARSLLRYRQRRLPAAIRNAMQEGQKGAMYPWQSADSGGEETQTVHYNPKSGKWDPDLSRRQRHVSIAIFYNFWKYYEMTGDKDFLEESGMNTMLEIARFWEGLSKYDKKTGKYHIEGVMGPDEFHEKLPKSKKPGLKDNAYTNIMVSWLLKKSVELAELSPDKTCVSNEELKNWKDISENLNVNHERGIIEQFDGYFKLPELDWNRYKKKYGDIHRMDRILKAEGRSPDNYKVSKQADTLMPFYNIDLEEVVSILKSMGIKINNPESFFKKNYRYYESRTSHGSSLSKIVHGVISSHLGDETVTRKFLEESLSADISERIRKDTSDGIHCGLMAGTIDFIIRRYGGVNYHKPIIEIDPDLPADWNGLSFKLIHRGVTYEFHIGDKTTIIPSTDSRVILKGKKRMLKGKKKNVF